MVGGKRHILFISYYPGPNILKKCLLLRSSGEYYITFVGCCIREDVEILRWVDQAYEASDYAELYTLLKHASPYIVHIQTPHQLWAAFSIDALHRDVPLVLDVYDCELLVHKEQDAFACRLEKDMVQRANALCHKLPPQGVEAWRKKCAFDVFEQELQSLPCRLFFETPEKLAGEELHIAYAGGVMPRHIALECGHANQIFDPLIQALSDAGIYLHMYVNRNARDMFFHEHKEYHEMARTSEYFLFDEGVPYHKLPNVLSSFHYGILYDNLYLNKYNEECFDFNYSTKIYTYIEAGLPVIIHKQFKSMSEFVNENGLGIVYDAFCPDSIKKIIKNADWISMHQNIIEYRKKNEISSLFEKINKLYTECRLHAKKHCVG